MAPKIFEEAVANAESSRVLNSSFVHQYESNFKHLLKTNVH